MLDLRSLELGLLESVLRLDQEWGTWTWSTGLHYHRRFLCTSWTAGL